LEPINDVQFKVLGVQKATQTYGAVQPTLNAIGLLPWEKEKVLSETARVSTVDGR